MRRFLMLFVLLAACAPRGNLVVVPIEAVQGPIVPVFTASSRETDPDGQPGRNRAETPAFGRYDIAIPPNREAGDIRFTRKGNAPDASRDFLTTGAVIYDGSSDFRTDLSRALRAQPADSRDAVIYIHGYNTRFAEGVYRMAQLRHDYDLPGVAVHYAWPSAGTPFGYVHDRDSALFARDGLETLLHEVAAAKPRRIVLVAHSMGSSVAMEALRTAAIRRDRQLLDKLSGVVLISPDIDLDVFRAQARAMDTLPQPFLIFGSTRDRALSLSAAIVGRQERLGNLRDISRVADLQVTYLDVAAYASGSGHFALGDNPALIALMGRIGDVDAALMADDRARIGLLPGVVLTVRNATEIVLAPVEAVANKLDQ